MSNGEINNLSIPPNSLVQEPFSHQTMEDCSNTMRVCGPRYLAKSLQTASHPAPSQLLVQTLAGAPFSVSGRDNQVFFPIAKLACDYPR